MRSKNEQLSLVVEDSAHLKDELDILRDKSAKAEKMETVVETYKRKLEDAAEVKRQMKLLEEKNASFHEKTLNMEEELKKSTSVKNQLENYKRQVQELQLKLADEIKRADRAEFEKVGFCFACFASVVVVVVLGVFAGLMVPNSF